MLRSILVSFCSLILRIFFRRIEVLGRHHLPPEGSVLFVLNHPNGLVDPLFILCLSGKRVSFLAKEPLFRTPIISIFVKAFESLAVYRSRDGADPARNQLMMKAAARLLASGNALAIFPEGTSHSAPQLLPFRSGAARIALASRALGEQEVYLVPTAIYYEEKESFRSRAVLAFGQAIQVPHLALGESGESPSDAVRSLTFDLAKQVEGLLPTAQEEAGLELAEHAERIVSVAVAESPQRCPSAAKIFERTVSPSLGQRMISRRRLIDGYQKVIDSKNSEVQELISRIQNLRQILKNARLPLDATTTPLSAKEKTQVFFLVLGSLLLAPLAALSVIINGPAYLLVRFISRRYSGADLDVVATVKVLAALLLFPGAWLVTGVVTAYFTHLAPALLVGLLGPVLGAASIQFMAWTGTLRRKSQASFRAARANLDWNFIREERAQLSEELARLLLTSPSD